MFVRRKRDLDSVIRSENEKFSEEMTYVGVE